MDKGTLQIPPTQLSPSRGKEAQGLAPYGIRNFP